MSSDRAYGAGGLVARVVLVVIGLNALAAAAGPLLVAAATAAAVSVAAVGVVRCAVIRRRGW